MMPQTERIFPQQEEPSPCNAKKKVQWVSRVKLYLFEPRSDDTLDEMWYHDTDYTRFKAESRFIINKARRRCLDSGYQSSMSVVPTTYHDGEDYCTRGLEHLICNERKHLQHHRRHKVQKLVWLEQKRQWDAGEESPQLIAEQCRKFSEMCQIQAQMQGFTHFLENTFGNQLQQEPKEQFSDVSAPRRQISPEMIEKKQLTPALA
jgi:hypothetical protein